MQNGDGPVPGKDRFELSLVADINLLEIAPLDEFAVTVGEVVADNRVEAMHGQSQACVRADISGAADDEYSVCCHGSAFISFGFRWACGFLHAAGMMVCAGLSGMRSAGAR